MNQISQTLVAIGRQLIAGFLFTSGGLLALAAARAAFHFGVCQ